RSSLCIGLQIYLNPDKFESRTLCPRCPLYPQKRTLDLAREMSALCQKRTHAMQHKSANLGTASREPLGRRPDDHPSLSDLGLVSNHECHRRTPISFFERPVRKWSISRSSRTALSATCTLSRWWVWTVRSTGAACRTLTRQASSPRSLTSKREASSKSPASK